jgi:hypothetical protein
MVIDPQIPHVEVVKVDVDMSSGTVREHDISDFTQPTQYLGYAKQCCRMILAVQVQEVGDKLPP